MKSKSAGKIKLTSYDELFGAEESNVEGTYTKVPLSQLRPFRNHPFKVLDDEKNAGDSGKRDAAWRDPAGNCAPMYRRI